MQTARTAACAAKAGEAVLSGEAPSRRLEARCSQRTNLFVAAALYNSVSSCPVKVRNLSESGALVEASVLPPPATKIRLCRGSLAVSGKVVWQRAGRAGLRFDSAITVSDWLPKSATQHQSRVDEMVHHVKMGRPADSTPLSEALALSQGPQEWEALASSIEQLADDLAADSHLVAYHSWKLQKLEMIAQEIRRIVAKSFSE